METKGSQYGSTTLSTIPLTEGEAVYIAIKGSLYANECSAFGLGQEDIKALMQKFPGCSSFAVVNGIAIGTNSLQALNALKQLGYEVILSTGESEITWTLRREI